MAGIEILESRGKGSYGGCFCSFFLVFLGSVRVKEAANLLHSDTFTMFLYFPHNSCAGFVCA